MAGDEPDARRVAGHRDLASAAAWRLAGRLGTFVGYFLTVLVGLPIACVVPEGRRTCEPPLHPLGDYRLSGGVDRVPITLELRQGRVCPPGIASLDAVWVRYAVLGGRHEQRIPLEQAPSVRCP